MLVFDLFLSRARTRYRGTWAGFLWVVLNPLILFTTQALIFRHVLKIEMPSYALFLLGGLLPWTFLATAIQMDAGLLRNSRELLLSFPLGPLALVGAAILDHGASFLGAFGLALLACALSDQLAWSSLLCLPLAFLPLAIGTFGLLLWVSILHVFYRDVRYVAQFALQVLFFVTPVCYPLELLPPSVAQLARWSPLTLLIEPTRQSLLAPGSVAWFHAWMWGSGAALALLALGLARWQRTRNEFYLAL